MDRIQTQTIEMKLPDPVQRVIDEELANRKRILPVKIYSSAPRRLMPIGEELWRVAGQEVALRSEVIVDNIQQHHSVKLTPKGNSACIIGHCGKFSPS